mgnify:FL=1
MPSIPKMVTLTNSSVDVLNAIRNSATQNYQSAVPIATPDPESIRTIGAIIMNNPQLQNEFLNNLVNRIGRVIISSKLYENPWRAFKKGKLEYGETIEEIFVNIAKPFQYDPEVSQNTLFKREKPDVRSAFHIMNYQKFYKTTVDNDRLNQAFLSWNGITELIGYIVDSLSTGANYDEFLVMKYMVGRHILNGQLKVVTIPAVATANMKEIVSTVKETSNDLTFLSNKNNIAHVYNHSEKNRQNMIVSSQFDAKMDVEVLAAAFNMSKAEFSGKRTLVNKFGEVDNERLAELFAGDDTYVPFTDAEIAALNSIPAILVDDDWFQIYDNLEKYTELPNPEALSWNYFFHVWKTFSVSPFAPAVVFVSGTPSVTSIDVSPATATAYPGQTIQMTADVTVANFASKSVEWSITSGGDYASISTGGALMIDNDAPANTEIVVKATSLFDGTTNDTATITVASVGSVTSVTVAPATATVAQSGTQKFTATVVKTGNVSGAVEWSATTGGTMSDDGTLTVAADATGTITVTATSVADNSVTGTATVTVDT